MKKIKRQTFINSFFMSMSNTVELNQKISSLHIFFHVDEQNCRIRNFQFCIQRFQLLQNSHVVFLFLFCHKTKDNIKVFMQSDLIADDKERHLVFIRFVNTVHHENFIINFQNDLRIFL